MAAPTNKYTYDALYRLIKCEGREHASVTAAINSNNGPRAGNTPLPGDSYALRRYCQRYTYDAVGNMLQMKHTTTGCGSWMRNFTISSTSNRLRGNDIGSDDAHSETYTYDARGNMKLDGMNHLRSSAYDALNRLSKLEITTTMTAYYQYDSGGQRVRKVLVNSAAALKHVRKYVGGWELYQKIDTGHSTILLERETLHVMDDAARVAVIDTPAPGTVGEVQTLRYQFSNHLGTALLELDHDAQIISYEEYYPYGNTSYQAGRSADESLHLEYIHKRNLVICKNNSPFTNKQHVETTHITGSVKLLSNLPIEQVGEILSSKVFSGLEFGGKELNIYDEVPAIFIKNGLLGFSIVLYDNSGYECDYILNLIPNHITKNYNGESAKIDLYLTSLVEEALENVAGIKVKY